MRRSSGGSPVRTTSSSPESRRLTRVVAALSLLLTLQFQEDFYLFRPSPSAYPRFFHRLAFRTFFSVIAAELLLISFHIGRLHPLHPHLLPFRRRRRRRPRHRLRMS